MTHDKVRQDLVAYELWIRENPPKVGEQMMYGASSVYTEDFVRKVYQAARAAERAEIREKLESEHVRWFAEMARSEFMSDNSDSIPDLPIRKSEAMKAAITKILEVI